MEKLLFIGSLLFQTLVTVLGNGGMGKGTFKVLDVRKCPDQDKYPLNFDIRMKRLDRVNFVFDLDCELEEPLDNSYGVDVNACKVVDGGCKPISQIQEPDIEDMIEKYAKSNFADFLECTGTELKGLPLPPGKLEARNYKMNMCEFPKKYDIAIYNAIILLLKDDEARACINVNIEFAEGDEECPEEENASMK